MRIISYRVFYLIRILELKKLKIAGWLPCSMMEWEGEISSVIFTHKCNWKCPYCHAAALHSPCEMIEEKKILDYLDQYRDWITSVVITGGEPTLYEDGLIKFIEKLKQRDLAVMLRTNGSNSKVIDELTSNMLIDNISLDFKTPFELYNKVANCEVDVDEVLNTFELIQDKPVSIEYRTVLCADFIDEEKIRIMGEYLSAKRGKWTLTEINGNGVLDAKKLSGKLYTVAEMAKLTDIAGEYFEDVQLIYI